VAVVSAMKRRIDELERQVRGSIAVMWVLANRAGGEIHLTNAELVELPRGAQLEQKQTSIGVKIIARDPWKALHDKIEQQAVSAATPEETQEHIEALIALEAGDTQTTE
jgi:hypothetical protein